MLLRRLGNSLRRQDWFAAATELVVVVVGVFLALQASNWNEARRERLDEQAIIERLHDETGDLLEAVRAERALVQTRVDALHSAQPVIFSMEPGRPLTGMECEAVAYSHVYRKPSDELPVMDELIGTGRFDRLRNDEIRRMLRSYILFRDRQRANHEERVNELFRLYSRHSDVITLRLVPAESDYSPFFTVMSNDAYKWQPDCDVARMRTDQQFLNETFDNMGRNSYLLQAYAEREEILVSLREQLGAAIAP
ncbi:hypothetical protein [Aurantiacibacter odishensis]|uniref:hypothetical protein n=1 Tax=Aurantiacibacter odishensis TaxID=1155476 RepID=UPI000E7559C3|nr:hypothetical protein [Aurantiacibacter odishensis]